VAKTPACGCPTAVCRAVRNAASESNSQITNRWEKKKTLDVGEAELKVGQNRDDALGFMFCAKPLWYVAAFLIGTAYKSDGPKA